jgi:Uncharacterised protein conserved in bacteria (DUF2336)
MNSPFDADLRNLAVAAASGDFDAVQVAFRVKVDMLVAIGQPSAGEMAAFESLATALVPRVDELTAVWLAAKLANWPHTPESVRSLLFARDGRVAAAMLAGHAPLPQGVLIEDIVRDGHIEIARNIAARADLADALCMDLLDRDDAGVDRALAANTALALPRDCMDLLVERARQDPACAELLLARKELSETDVVPLYLMAGEVRRGAMRAALEQLNNISAMRQGPSLSDTEWLALDYMAGTDLDAALGMLTWHLGAGTTLAAVLVRDQTRETTALALRALGLPVEKATRFLLRLKDAAATSVPRIFGHVDLMRTVSTGTAMRILVAVSGDAALRLALLGSRPAAEHVPVMAEGGARVRAGSEKPAVRRTLAGTVDRALRRDQA